MIPILILAAVLSVFTGPTVTDVGGGIPTATATVDDVGGGIPTH